MPNKKNDILSPTHAIYEKQMNLFLFPKIKIHYASDFCTNNTKKISSCNILDISVIMIND